MIKESYATEIEDILSRYPTKRSAVLPLMHLAQQEYGYMSDEAKREVAEILDLDPTHILSIAGFYTLYYEEPVGKYVLEVCNDLACALRGADDFLDMVLGKLDVELHGTTDDGLFTVKNVMCIGACDRAPVLQCNLKFHDHLDEAQFDALVGQWRNGSAETPSIVDQIIAGRTE